MISIRKVLGSKDFKLFAVTFLLTLAVILFIYQGVFALQFQGDGWQYAWTQHVDYKSIFSPQSLHGMRTSLGGAALTFGLIENTFGLNPQVFYSIGIILKFISVLVFYFLVKKLTKIFFASLVASLILSATFVGIEATHWVFNMYAYIGLIFMMISIIIGLDLPQRFTFKKWFLSFIFACLAIWYATMRTNGIIPLTILWSLYQFIILKSKSSRLNLISWVIGLTVFILIDKFVLGQMESDYSQKYIINEGIRAIKVQLAASKYDFLLSSTTNLGAAILPDMSWYSFDLPKSFSIFGATLSKSVILPSFLIFLLFTKFFTTMLDKGAKQTKWISSKLLLISILGLGWTGLVFFVMKLGPANFSSWVYLVMTLFGGYMMIINIYLIFAKNTPPHLKNLFFLSFFWSFLFLLLPLFQNGGPLLGTYHRYMATTAPSVALFVAGLLSLGSFYKNTAFKTILFLVIILMIITNASSTRAFFNRKALVHGREVSDRIWQQLLEIIPNKPDYRNNPPAMFFISTDNPIDTETLFESVSFGVGFRFGVDYNWRPDHVNAVYNRGDYQNLLNDVKKNPKLLDDFYAVVVQNQNLFDITRQVKEKLTSDAQL